MLYNPYTNNLWYGCEKPNLPTLEKSAKKLKIIKCLRLHYNLLVYGNIWSTLQHICMQGIFALMFANLESCWIAHYFMQEYLLLVQRRNMVDLVVSCTRDERYCHLKDHQRHLLSPGWLMFLKRTWIVTRN